MERLDILTEREQEVLNLLVTGISNDEIAKKLFISTHTVKAHLENIYRKLELHNKVQVAVYAVMHGLVE